MTGLVLRGGIKVHGGIEGRRGEIFELFGRVGAWCLSVYGVISAYANVGRESQGPMDVKQGFCRTYAFCSGDNGDDLGKYSLGKHGLGCEGKGEETAEPAR